MRPPSNLTKCGKPPVNRIKGLSLLNASLAACNIADVFGKTRNFDRMQALQNEYSKLNENYFGLPVSENIVFDTELVSKVIADLKTGKAADIAGLTSEHLLFSHPVLPVILSKLFNVIFQCQHVPAGFKYSYIVPVPKVKDCRNKAMTCNDFRAITISPILCKVFEYCLLDKFNNMLKTSDTQFGFKKGLSCNHAYTLYDI